MKNKFRKIMSVVGSVLMVGSTMGIAAAAGGVFPSPFVQNSNAQYAIVYGTGAAASDVTAANSLNAYLNTFYTETATTTTTSTTSTITGDFSSSSKVTYEEIELGDSINKTLTDNKVSSLIDYDFRWDDGNDSKNYDVHEEIILNSPKIQTTWDNNELNTSVVLENDKAVEYRYVFDDALDINSIGHEDADKLEITILGKEYEVISMDANSLTVSTSDEKIVSIGSIIIVDGVTLKIEDIFDETIAINGILIDEGRKKTINGIEVYVDTIAYHSSSTLPSKAIIKVGKDIEQTFDNGDEYINEDETWEWHIENLGTVGGFIGVKYDRRNVGFDDDDLEDNAISAGQSYILPENYGAVSFDGLTNVTYEDFELSFDDKKLYTGIGTNGQYSDVAMLEGENDDSITIGGSETNKIYFKYNQNITDHNVTMYFKDIDGDIDSNNEGRNQLIGTYNFGNDSIEKYLDIAKLIVDDTELKVGLLLGNDTFNYNVTLTLTKPNNMEVIEIPLGIDNDDFKHLGDDDGNAESEDIVVDGKKIGTEEDDIMDHYGLIIKDPENYADNDRVILSVPSEQVYATISIKGQGTEVTSTEDANATEVTPVLGGIIIKDSEINNVKNKNLIIVGGSCINAEAARLLGGKACGEDFTLKTGIVAGKALIQTFASPHNASNVAVVIAGYHAADTTKGVNAVINTDIDISLGKKTIV